MKLIKINEAVTKRGMNNLFYQIEIYNINEKNNKLQLINTVSYMRKHAKILHETSIFKLFSDMENEKWNDEQCLNCVKILCDTIKLIDKMENLLYPFSRG